MINRLSHTRFALVALAAALLFVGACGDDDPEVQRPPSPAISGLDFAAGSEVDLGEGWTVSPCEAGPALFCARRGGETQAVVELMSVPTSSYSSVKEILDAGGSAMKALRAQAVEFQAEFESDRPAGCGAGYAVKPFGPEQATVAGSPGVLYGFDGKQDGRHVERVLLFAAIEGATMHLISTNAVNNGSCMDDGELSEFSVAELTHLQPRIVRMIAASMLP